MSKIDSAPEIKKRTMGDEDAINELLAASDYVDEVAHTADCKQYPPMWASWALREAFLAGVTYHQTLTDSRRVS
jgi:hypothetical protein